MTKYSNFPTHTLNFLSQLTFLTVYGHDSGSQLTDVVCKELYVIIVSAEVLEVLHIQPEDHQLNRTVFDTEVHELCTQETMYTN